MFERVFTFSPSLCERPAGVRVFSIIPRGFGVSQAVFTCGLWMVTGGSDRRIV